MSVVVGILLMVVGAAVAAFARPIAERERRRLDAMPAGRLRIGAPNQATTLALGLTLFVIGLVTVLGH